MKRTVIFWLAALFAIASLSAQEVKPARYIINGKVVKEFDGSQLVGQTITHYRLDGEHNAHIIFTSAYQGDTETMKKEAQATLEGVTKGKISALTIHDGEAKPKADQSEENIYVINGKVVPYSEFKELSSNKDNGHQEQAEPRFREVCPRCREIRRIRSQGLDYHYRQTLTCPLTKKLSV